MEPAFWLQKWQANEIGFHQTEIHPLLLAHWAEIGCRAGQRVLVPLCGKSLDMRWLAAAGLTVIGFELSELAARAYFHEQALEPEVAEVGAFRRFSTAQVTIFCGDFFAATSAICAPCDAIYDRAALIALAPSQRTAYRETLRALSRPTARGLLITVEYPAGAVSAPPFSIARSEVDALLQDWTEVRELARGVTDVKGVAALEVAYLVGGSGS
jgi:thiopurine S-methyltransferase